MTTEKRFLTDVGMNNMPFPIRVLSKTDPEGQPTVGNISVNARVMQEFEAGWIDRFIQVLHQHRTRIGPQALKTNILDYMAKLSATTVKIDLDYPFFIEKTTPVSKEKCLVRYMCTYSSKVSPVDKEPKILFRINVPCITTDPISFGQKPGGVFAQLSMMTIEIESTNDIYAEDLVALVDNHALSPIYSFLTQEDHDYIIEKVHSERKSSVVTTDEIKNELARNHNIGWYSINCSNFAMLHSYSTIVATEKSMWIPMSSYDDDQV